MYTLYCILQLVWTSKNVNSFLICLHMRLSECRKKHQDNMRDILNNFKSFGSFRVTSCQINFWTLKKIKKNIVHHLPSEITQWHWLDSSITEFDRNWLLQRQDHKFWFINNLMFNSVYCSVSWWSRGLIIPLYSH